MPSSLSATVAYVPILALFASCRAGPYDFVAKQFPSFVTTASTGVCISITKKGSRYIGKRHEERKAGKD
jgi:hypothetical protein